MEIREVVAEFFKSLTDRQLVVFCLLYGYNERGITLTMAELAVVLGNTPESVRQTREQITTRLGQKRFRSLVEKLNEYETLSN